MDDHKLQLPCALQKMEKLFVLTNTYVLVQYLPSSFVLSFLALLTTDGNMCMDP